MREITVGKTPKWSVAAVTVMFLACRAGRRSAYLGTAIWRVRYLKISRAMARFSFRRISIRVWPLASCRCT